MDILCRLLGHKRKERAVRVSWRRIINTQPDIVDDGTPYMLASYCSRCNTWLALPIGARLPLPELEHPTAAKLYAQTEPNRPAPELGAFLHVPGKPIAWGVYAVIALAVLYLFIR